MTQSAKHVVRTYTSLIFTSTLASSMIWGVNTLFLLDAGLNNFEAFTANAFFTLGQVLFEIPTGVIADSWGRRSSYLLGTLTLIASTGLYLLLWQLSSPLWMWAMASMLLGLGFTFFSGATEAWLVDALRFTNFTGSLESAFAKGQIALGIAMLTGSVMGGFIAQFTNLGVPYILRVFLLLITLLIAAIYMRDLGFTPDKSSKAIPHMKHVANQSIKFGFKNRPIRWLMLAAPFTGGVSIYGFYALQPYLLELYGDSSAYAIAGLAAAIVAGGQIAGGLLISKIRKLFNNRTTLIATGVILSFFVLLVFGLTNNFYLALATISVWAIVYAATSPVRQAYINDLIPSKQRATVLSVDALMGSSGGIVSQPALGRSADIFSYSFSYVISAAIQLVALPFTMLARKEKAKSDPIK